MSNYLKSLLVVLLMLIGSLLLFSCAKNTTGPSSSTLTEQFANCNWRVSCNVSSPTVSTWGVSYYATAPLNVIPTVSLGVNGSIYPLTFGYSTQYYDSYSYTYSATNLPNITAGNEYNLSLTVNGNTNSTTLTVPHSPTLVSSPSTFNKSRDNTFSWQISNNPRIYILGFYWSATNAPTVGQVTKYIDSNSNSYTVPANTVPSDWRVIQFSITPLNYSIVGSTSFQIQRAGVVKQYTP